MDVMREMSILLQSHNVMSNEYVIIYRYCKPINIMKINNNRHGCLLIAGRQYFHGKFYNTSLLENIFKNIIRF